MAVLLKLARQNQVFCTTVDRNGGWQDRLQLSSTIRSKPNGLAGIQLDGNAATGDFTLSLSPANLTAARRWSYPDRSDTVAGLGAQTFTGAQQVNNTVGVGVAPSSFSQVIVSNSGSISGSTQLAAFFSFVGLSSATSAIRGAQFSVSTPVAAMTCAEVTGLLVANNAAGAGSTITRSQGLLVSPQNAGANNCSILHDFSAAYSGNWFILDNGTYPSRFGGVVTVTDTTDATSLTAAALVCNGGAAVAKTLRVGLGLILGTDPGGSEILRVGGSLRCLNSLVITGAGAVPVLNSTAASDATTTAYFSFQRNASEKGWIGYGDGVSGKMKLYNSIGDIYLSPLSTVIIGTDPGGTDIVRIGGALTINSAIMIQTKTAFTNGAAAAAGTLANAPVAGNPTKWIPINDNGTTRYIPAW